MAGFKRLTSITAGGVSYDDEGAKQAGIEDAKANLPAVDDFDACPGFVRRIVGATTQMIQDETRLKDQGDLDGEIAHVYRKIKQIGTPKRREFEGRIPTVLNNRVAYYVLLLCLGIAEIILNSVVFQVMGEGRVATYITAAGLTLVLFAVAHITGVIFRRTGGLRAMVIVALGVVAAILALWAVAVLRVQFLTDTGIIEGQGDNWGMLYYGLNLFLFAAAFIAAVTKSTELELLEKRLAEMEEERKALWGTARSQADYLNSFCLQLCAVYREYNDRTRGQMAVWKDPVMAMPKQLEKYVPWSPDGLLQGVSGLDDEAAARIASGAVESV